MKKLLLDQKHDRYPLTYGIGTPLLLMEIILLTGMLVSCDFSIPIEEQSPVENAQVFVLLAASAVSFWAYARSSLELTVRQLFLIAACLLFVAAARELSFGRVLYLDAEHPVSVEVFRSYRYKLPCILLRGLSYSLVGFTVIYFLRQKLFRALPNLLNKMKIYVWDLMLLHIFIAMSVIGEKIMHNANIEEMCELITYLTVFNVCWRYARNTHEEWGACQSVHQES